MCSDPSTLSSRIITILNTQVPTPPLTHHRVGAHRARKAKVAQLDRAARADEDVLRLHVAVDDAVCVQVAQRAHQLLGDVAHDGFRERGVVLQDLEQLAVRELFGVCLCLFVVGVCLCGWVGGR